MGKVSVYTDGASRGNPGKASIGVVINDDNGNNLLTHKKYLGLLTNNAAEYTALIEGVRMLRKLETNFDGINFFCDSELIVKQIKGEYKIKHKDLIRLSLEFWNEIKALNKKFTITHIPREQNKHADQLANEALDEFNDTVKDLLIN